MGRRARGPSEGEGDAPRPRIVPVPPDPPPPWDLSREVSWVRSATEGCATARMKIFSERLPLKYLVSDYGVCLGVDTVRCSYLFLVSREGILLRRRPVGDRVVEDLDYHIPAIVRALEAEAARTTPAG